MGKVARSSEKKISVRIARFGPVDIEGSIEGGIGMLIDLIAVELAAQFEIALFPAFRLFPLSPVANLAISVTLTHHTRDITGQV